MGLFDGIGLSDVGDTLKFGVTQWAAEQQRQSAADTAAKAAQIEALKIQAIKQQQELVQAQTQQEKAKSSGAATKIKAYIVPIAITGGLVIVGIAAYFFFKKKNVN